MRQLRDERGYALDTLAECSGVSRSNISLIERGQSSPAASVLDKLATGLSVTVAALFEDAAAAAAPCPVARAAEQPEWRDPASGYQRRNLSPPGAGSPIQLVEVHFPGGQQVALDTRTRDNDVHQQVWVIDGEMLVTVGDTPWHLAAGDCLALRLDQPGVYRNPLARPARYLVALVNTPMPTPRRHP